VLPDGRRATPVFQLLAERYLDPQYSAEAVSDRCGIPVETIRRVARELAETAFEQAIRLPIAWTDVHGREHADMLGRPVAMHAMRGISAHSNGFHTCRALHVLQLLLGAVDTPGSFRYQPPFPRPIPPANRPGKTRKDSGALDAPPLGFIHGPEDFAGRRARQCAPHRPCLQLEISAGRARHVAHGNPQRLGRRSANDRRAVPVHGQHELELGDEHHRDHALAHRQERSR
jgi:anaerobic selenocysteine-containing dehydrogenase